MRTAAEFAQGHLDGALLIPFDEISQRAGEIGPKEQAAVVYCRSGRRSAIARQKLLELGYTTVYDLGPKSAW